MSQKHHAVAKAIGAKRRWAIRTVVETALEQLAKEEGIELAGADRR